MNFLEVDEKKKKEKKKPQSTASRKRPATLPHRYNRNITKAKYRVRYADNEPAKRNLVNMEKARDVRLEKIFKKVSTK